MKIIAIRHFKTASNQAGVLQGHRDVPILEDSVEETATQQNKNKIESELAVPELIVSSPLKRAVQTANIYGYAQPHLDSRLAEFDFGEFTGKPKTEMLAHRDGAWIHDFPSVDWGEGFHSFNQRILEFIEEAKPKYESVLMFTHGGVIRFLTAMFKTNQISEANSIHVDNNSLHLFLID